MKRHWIFIALAALLLPMLAGCPATPPGVKEAPSAASLSANPSLLPPPRPALEAAPDLSGASLVVNDATLAKMSADAVPGNITDALTTLKGKEFTNAAEFAAAVKGAAGAGADPYLERILRDALVVRLADEPPAPQGEVSISEREQRQAVASPFGLVYFDFDKYNIKPEFDSVIKDNAKKLMDNASMNVTIEGHCDERGTEEYNLALGERRAEAVRKALIAAGVPASRLKTISYGEERPVDPGHNEEAWAKNRRSVLTPN
jgi:peptidoglycan-associated lipoprotein